MIARSKSPERPYMWASKTALRKIVDSSFSGHGKELAVYFCLCWIASDEGFATFEASYSYIAKRAGMSKRSVIRALPELIKMGLIADKKGGLNQCNKYRILTMQKATKGSDSGNRTGDSAHPDSD